MVWLILYLVDVREKAGILKKNKEFMVKELGLAADSTLQMAIDEEVKLGVTRLNGENQKKELPKEKKGSWEWKYVSTARTYDKVIWIFDFAHALFDNITN